jgi:hypothetical protein
MANFQPFRNRMKLVSGNNPRDATRVSLPKDALRHLSWEKGDVIEISIERGGMFLRKVQ